MSEPVESLENRRGKERSRWDKTLMAEERIKNFPSYNKERSETGEKTYQGRPIIGRDRKINGGVYLGGGEREAIVVDDKKDLALDKIYQELINRRRMAQAKGIPFKQGILEEVWRLVSQLMPVSVEKVEGVRRKLPRPDTKIYLSAFIGGGVCRHQALLTAYLLERLVKEGVLSGRVSIDRNAVKDLGGHAWVRYTNSAGDIFILDSTHNYLGRLDKVDRNRWFYERPEDGSPHSKLIVKIRKALLAS